MSSFHSERRQFESALTRQRQECADLRAQLDGAVGAGRAREEEVAVMARKLSGADKSKSAVEECLADASGAIRAALAFQVYLLLAVLPFDNTSFQGFADFAHTT